MGKWPVELERVKIPADKAAVAMKRIKPLVDRWPLEIEREFVKQSLLSAYTQGLLDGAQVAKRMEAEHGTDED